MAIFDTGIRADHPHFRNIKVYCYICFHRQSTMILTYQYKKFKRHEFGRQWNRPWSKCMLLVCSWLLRPCLAPLIFVLPLPALCSPSTRSFTAAQAGIKILRPLAWCLRHPLLRFFSPEATSLARFGFPRPLHSPSSQTPRSHSTAEKLALTSTPSAPTPMALCVCSFPITTRVHSNPDVGADYCGHDPIPTWLSSCLGSWRQRDRRQPPLQSAEGRTRQSSQWHLRPTGEVPWKSWRKLGCQTYSFYSFVLGS
jgi:hypothetical protein